MLLIDPIGQILLSPDQVALLNNLIAKTFVFTVAFIYTQMLSYEESKQIQPANSS